MVDVTQFEMTHEQKVALVSDWYEAQKEAKAANAKAQMLKRQVVSILFPKPVEGSKNREDLGEGWDLKLTHKINRTVDMETAKANQAEIDAVGIPMDLLIKWTPELKTSEFRKLNEDQKLVVSKFITEKDGSPTLEVVPAKK